MEEDIADIEEIIYKKKNFSDKNNIAIIILSILLMISLWIQLVTFGDDKTLIEVNSSLTSIVEEKEQTIEDNEIQIQNLQSENKKLSEEKVKLENEINGLLQEKQRLETENAALEQEKQILNTQIDNLKKTSSTKVNTQNSSSSTNNTQSSTTTQNTNSTIVYVTKTGEKYHKSSCSYLRQSKIQINLSDAKNLGYTPCSRCY